MCTIRALTASIVTVLTRLRGRKTVIVIFFERTHTSLFFGYNSVDSDQPVCCWRFVVVVVRAYILVCMYAFKLM